MNNKLKALILSCCVLFELKAWQGPDFIIIGTQKGGTSSLYNYMIKHPQILGASYKEIHFFDRHFQKGINWYKTQFPVKTKGYLIGESSPMYMYHPLVPERIYKNFPKTKFIVLLRNPVDRLISHYFMRNRNDNPLDLEDAYQKNLLAQTAYKNLIENKEYDINELVWGSYFDRGLYFEQLKSWEKYFPKTQFLIIFSEEFFKDPSKTLAKVFKFLELPNHKLKKYNIHNKSKSKKIVNPEDKKKIADYYINANQQLGEYLGINLPW